MPPPIPVIIAPYDPRWPFDAKFHSECLQVLGRVLVTVHHVGSTSVPGLAAKPIIDLLPVVTDLAVLDRMRFQVESCGYRWHGELGLAGRRYCTLSDAVGRRLIQLHIFQQNSPEVVRHLAFRDHLRAHKSVARRYELEKRRLSALFPNDSHAYADAKSSWIEKVQAEAFASVAHR